MEILTYTKKINNKKYEIEKNTKFVSGVTLILLTVIKDNCAGLYEYIPLSIKQTLRKQHDLEKPIRSYVRARICDSGRTYISVELVCVQLGG